MALNINSKVLRIQLKAAGTSWLSCDMSHYICIEIATPTSFGRTKRWHMQSGLAVKHGADIHLDWSQTSIHNPCLLSMGNKCRDARGSNLNSSHKHIQQGTIFSNILRSRNFLVEHFCSNFLSRYESVWNYLHLFTLYMNQCDLLFM